MRARLAALRGRVRPTPALVVVLVVALLASIVVLGEPNRPATATVVRPVVTVPALCSAPTVIDVAARDADRGLTAIGQLLGVGDELVGELARDLRVVDTDAGVFFVLVRDDELRVAALSPAGLPIVDSDAVPPQTHRVFSLGELEGRPSVVASGSEGVFVVFGGDATPAAVFALTPTTLTSSVEVSVARDAAGPELADPLSRTGAAVVRDGVLWLAGDDGRVVTFDPLAEGEERWAERADGLLAPLLARTEGGVLGVFPTDVDGADAEVRTFDGDGDVATVAVTGPVRAVTGVTYAASAVPAFTVDTGGGAGVLRARAGSAEVTSVPGVDGDVLGVVATDGASAVLTVRGRTPRYEVFDVEGAALGSFGEDAEGRCTEGPWPDAGALFAPSSAGSLLHLHDPSSPWDCVADSRDPEELAELPDRCAPEADWSIDKGSAPARDFTVEIGRALDELAADDLEREAEAATEDVPATAEAIQEELSESGLDVTETEVDPDFADECAAEEVTSVAPPTLDLAEAVGARAVRAEWTWSGGTCLPGRYLVTMCHVAAQGGGCSDTTEREVTANPTSARSSLELPARPDRTYRVSVRAAKGRVVSEPSGALLVTTPAVTPDPPVGVSGALQDGTWRLAWTSCLAGGNCDQRPDGFVVTVEGCEGDSLGLTRRRFDVSQRGTTFGADGAGFGVDLLGRRVQFRVATTSGERVSEPVRAGGCTASVRPGRDAAASSLGVSLTGRQQQVTLAPLGGGRQLTELFGTSRYDDVSVRLVRGGTATSSRTGALHRSVTFDVARCVVSGWTLEVTPRFGGQDLPAHRSRLTDASVACDPSVDGSTRISPVVTGSSSRGIDLRVTIPQLSDDVDNGLVAGVRGTARCATAFEGTRSYELSGGRISGDDVAFSMPVPVVFDLRGACTIGPVVSFTSGGSATPEPRRVSLDPAGRAIVDQMLPAAARQLERARTATYEQRTGLPGLGRADVVDVRHGGSGVPCSRAYGSSIWSFTVSGTRQFDCSGGAHAIAYAERDLNDGRGPFELEVRLGGLAGLGGIHTSSRTTIPVCQLPSGDPRPPCAPEPEPCEHDSSLPADDPNCFEPCPSDPSIPADHEDCDAPEPCPGLPGIPIGDPRCDPEPPPEDPDPPEPDPEASSLRAAPTTTSPPDRRA
jgi:hypothetical protein